MRKLSKGQAKRYVSSPQGRAALASAMSAPLRRNLSYAGLARKVLNVQQLPPGALPSYDRDIDVSAVITAPEKKKEYKHDVVIISSHGKTFRRQPGFLPNIRRVVFPTFEIVSNPTISLAEVKRRRFDIIDRAAQRKRWEIQAEEDAKVFAALDAASGNNEPLTIPDSEEKMDQGTINKVSLGIKIFGAVLAVVAVVGIVYSFIH